MTTTEMTVRGLVAALCLYGIELFLFGALFDEWRDHKENPRYRVSYYWQQMPGRGRTRRYDTRKDDER